MLTTPTIWKLITSTTDVSRTNVLGLNLSKKWAWNIFAINRWIWFCHKLKEENHFEKDIYNVVGVRGRFWVDPGAQQEEEVLVQSSSPEGDLMKTQRLLTQMNMQYGMNMQGGRGSAVWLERYSGWGPGVWRDETENEGEWQSQGKNEAKTQITQ